MAHKEIDYIIVGQGLAGSCLALQLISLNRKILVIDRQNTNSATRVAAGLFNPITGRLMNKTWLADELFPYLHKFYKRAEVTLGAKFFFPMPLYRPFISTEEQNEWMGKSATAGYGDYIKTICTSAEFSHQVNNPNGGLLLKQCGFVDTNVFCDSLRSYLTLNQSFLDEWFDSTSLMITSNGVTYKDFRSKRIILCTGVFSGNNLFSWLPLRPLKGETLTIQTDEKVSKIYNRGVYVVPGLWRVGATYNTKDSTEGVTADGKAELIEKLNELISFPYTIINHDWGFRPTTPDRRPMLGAHPEFEQVFIFNGLGTKGVSLAPYFSEVLTRWMENGHPIDNQVSVNRYKSLYWNSA